MHLHRIGKKDPPDEAFQESISKLGILLHDSSGDWHVDLIQGGMVSGAPAVVVWVPTDKGVVILETSLDAWRAATVAMASMAEAHFGYIMHD